MDGLATAASLGEAKERTIGGIIQTIYQPEQGMFVVHIYSGKPVRLLLSPQRALVHVTEVDFPHPQNPSPFTMLLRKHLRGTRIVGLNQQNWERVVILESEKPRSGKSENLLLISELLGVHGNMVLVGDGRVRATLRRSERLEIGSPYRLLPAQEKVDPAMLMPEDLGGMDDSDDPSRFLVQRVDGVGKQTASQLIAWARDLPGATIEERVVQAVRDVLSYVKHPHAEYDAQQKRASFFPFIPPGEKRPSFSFALDSERSATTAALKAQDRHSNTGSPEARAVIRREATIGNLTRQLTKAQGAGEIRHRADLIMIHKTDLSRRMNEATLIDPSNDSRVVVPLDPRLGPVENAQRLYQRAKRLERAKPIIKRQIERISKELESLRADSPKLAKSRSEIDQYKGSPASPPPKASSTSRAYRLMNHSIRVGRNARDNEALVRQSHPDDLWLHVRGFTGAHVVIRRNGKQPIPGPVIRRAAVLAARFSQVAKEPRVTVSYTPVKYLRKPKGSPPGLVIASREDTLVVNPQEATLHDDRERT